MDRQLPVGPLLAGVGAVILAVSLFLDWWDGVSAFDVYELLDLVLLGLALATIVALAGGLGLMRPAITPGVSLAVAILTVVIVVSQVLNDPPAVIGSPRGHAVGIWLALVGGVLMTVGALLAYARISLAVDVRPRGGDGRGDSEGSESRPPGKPAVDPDAPTQRP